MAKGTNQLVPQNATENKPKFSVAIQSDKYQNWSTTHWATPTAQDGL